MPPKKRPKARSWRSEARGAPAVRAALRRLGKRVRALREDRGLSQEGLAEKARLDGKHVQAIEGGRVNATVATLVGLARALGVTLSALFEKV